MVKYQLQVYFKGSSFAMPCIVTAIFLYMMYSVRPLNVVSGFLLSCVFAFFLMSWVSMSSVQKENQVLEQILLLRMRSPAEYYIAKYIFICSIALLFTILCTGFPIAQEMFNTEGIFDRTLTWADCMNAFLLIGGCSLCGAAMGEIFHPQMLKDRKIAIVLTVLFAIVTLCRYQIESSTRIARYILWILPPVMLPAKIYGNKEFFDIMETGKIFLILLLYAIAYSIVRSLVCHKKRF